MNNETKISEPAHSPAAKVVHSGQKQRTKRHHSKLLNDYINSESESSHCDSKISHSTSWSGAKVVHSNEKRRMQRQNLNVPKDSIYSESDSSCNSRISESTSL